jgi:hypothetical protein
MRSTNANHDTTTLKGITATSVEAKLEPIIQYAWSLNAGGFNKNRIEMCLIGTIFIPSQKVRPKRQGSVNVSFPKAEGRIKISLSTKRQLASSVNEIECSGVRSLVCRLGTALTL